MLKQDSDYLLYDDSKATFVGTISHFPLQFKFGGNLFLPSFKFITWTAFVLSYAKIACDFDGQTDQAVE